METVSLVTQQGTITLEINTEAAPVSASHFLKYVDGGHLDGAQFYRVVRPSNDASPSPIEVVQGGLMGDVYGRVDWEELDNLALPFQPIAHESNDETGLLNLRGTIAWARNEPGTSNSEFFINVIDNSALDTGSTLRNPDAAGYAVFGRVREGMDVVETIQSGSTAEPKLISDMQRQVLDAPVVIQRAERLN